MLYIDTFEVATSDISMILSYSRSLLLTSIHASVPPDRIKRLPGSEVFNSSRNADSESTLIYPSMLSDLANTRLSSRLIPKCARSASLDVEQAISPASTIGL